ncbi:15447_t:CDS:10 [Acaulospora morrowiae]|uniref:Elongator complex protein 1 n=1 Tax=Acaulospora morrowiae TaxID=94023 RepID=A0A9N8VAE5_9GLOM|nr:15447_t:CDS:10 [Acaulospora morrowiae]
MKSLTLLSEIIVPRCFPYDERSKRTFHTINPESADFYFLRFSDSSLSNVELVKCSELETLLPDMSVIASFPNSDHTQELNEIVRGLKFLMDTQSICIAFAGGDIFMVSLDGSVEVMGSVDSHIKCMEWSPDEEVVVFVTGNDTILEMTKDFDVITEFPINVEELGEAVSISVGWGKKETQFHGSEGKLAAQRIIDVSNFTLSEDDDTKTRVSWCGDGSMFCCSAIDSNRELRVIRVYNREGVLQSTSEPVDGLGHILSWRYVHTLVLLPAPGSIITGLHTLITLPAGNLIASSQKFSDKQEIIFFEKNGLRHGEFTLRETLKHKIIEILWNCDSTVLAVWLERGSLETEKSSCVQLWNANNYHWYLKQEILMKTDDFITSFSWDPETALRLYLTTQRKCHRLDFAWDNLYSNLIDKKNAAAVAVVDGSSVCLTPFRTMNVPPPMFAFSLRLDSPVSHVSFSPNNGGNDFAVLQANQDIAFFDWRGAMEKPAKPPTLMGSINMKFLDSKNEESIRQIAWIDKGTLLFLQFNSVNGSDDVCQIDVNLEKGCDQKIDDSRRLSNVFMVKRLHWDHTHKMMHLVSGDGMVLEVELKSESSGGSHLAITDSQLVRFPEPCTWVGSTKIGAEERVEKIVLGLSESNKLYACNKLISSDCTSFFIHNDFLIFTTMSHMLKFLTLRVSLSDLKVPVNTHDETVREVERGSKIVCAIYYDASVILQMPRGNLETISPRALLLESVRESLDRLDYKSAYITCRKHLEKVDYLNLFLSSLRNEDVTSTMYLQTNKIRILGDDSNSTWDTSFKINTVCDAVREVLGTLDTKTYLQSIIMTYIRRTPPDLESALGLLAKIKDQDPNLAEDAIKFTIFLVDADRLFDVALGMYDFNLVLMVAQQSQKDPREYLTFLANLESYPTNYQRFKIDDHLHRYEKALHNLSLSGDEHFEECLKYTIDHALYKSAISIFTNNREKYKRAILIYGDYLSTESNFKEAGLAYSLAGDKQKALESYKNSGSWREAFSIAHELNYSSDALLELANNLAESLSDKRQYHEAAQIILDYAKQPEEAIELLNKGRYWNEAMRISYMYNRSDLIQTNVKPSVIEGYTQSLQDVNSMLDQLNQQISRLREIRINKNKKPLDSELFHDEAIENVDVFSDTSSMASGFTRYTQSNTQLSVHSNRSGKSAKSRRRAERKKARGKKGSIYEEEYLIDSLRRLIERFNATQAEISNLLNCLVNLGIVKNAQQIQSLFYKLEELIKKSIDEIFDIPLTINVSAIEDDAEIDHVKPPTLKVIEKPKIIETNWKLQII